MNSSNGFDNLPHSFHPGSIFVSPMYLFDLVAGAGDALGDALVGPDGSG